MKATIRSKPTWSDMPCTRILLKLVMHQDYVKGMEGINTAHHNAFSCICCNLSLVLLRLHCVKGHGWASKVNQSCTVWSYEAWQTDLWCARRMTSVCWLLRCVACLHGLPQTLGLVYVHRPMSKAVDHTIPVLSFCTPWNTCASPVHLVNKKACMARSREACLHISIVAHLLAIAHFKFA